MKSSDSRPHLAVVGAGVAGLSCAMTLRAAGRRLRMFDRSRGPAAGSLSALRRTEAGGVDCAPLASRRCRAGRRSRGGLRMAQRGRLGSVRRLAERRQRSGSAWLS
ncbi:NAD(P)-binding protein [Paraburkholderia phytofirmans]|uniref:NAD(P)-binding protein n=1 Tax=Paraburkholderia phytofirmans TaxID=261302 RepID=UPI0038BB3B89